MLHACCLTTCGANCRTANEPLFATSTGPLVSSVSQVRNLQWQQMQLEKKHATLRQSGRELWNPGLVEHSGLSCNRVEMFLLAQTWQCGYQLTVLVSWLFLLLIRVLIWFRVSIFWRNLSQTSQGVFGIWPDMFNKCQNKRELGCFQTAFGHVLADCLWENSDDEEESSGLEAGMSISSVTGCLGCRSGRSQGWLSENRLVNIYLNKMTLILGPPVVSCPAASGCVGVVFLSVFYSLSDICSV